MIEEMCFCKQNQIKKKMLIFKINCLCKFLEWLHDIMTQYHIYTEV